MKVLPLIRLFALVSLIAIAVQSASAQNEQALSSQERKEKRERKQMRAVRIENGSIELDGRLDDAVWSQAEFVTDFLQVLPIEYDEPTNATEVAIVYDDDAIYIGARMYVDDPENLRMDLSRRDDRGLGEQIIITLDTYLDRRTSYGFGVTTAGVRFDRYNSTDNQRWDFSWDAVWDVRTSVDGEAWIAEFKIPFSQLRFNNTDEQIWGININRWRPITTEDIFWVVIPPSETGWASRFGNLVGIEGIKPSRRLELLPYVASDGRFTNNFATGDPYDDGSTLAGRVGGDLKMGLGPNLTLDVTFNPDFGQVEADPAEVNLTAYETRFEEKRPFFIEGNDLFSTIGPNYFYSRRIGSPPHGRALRDSVTTERHGSPNHNFVDAPGYSTILGAAKVTGRLQSGTSIGGLIAVTDSEYASFKDSEYLYIDSLTDPLNHDTTAAGPAVVGETKVEPTTVHGVIRVKQDFGEGGSTAGFILTGLTRNMDDVGLLAKTLTKQAYSGGIDWDIRFLDRTYSLRGWAGFSHITGTESAILKKQRHSAHYYQRPDASHVEVDSTRTSLSGYTGGIGFEKEGGDHWLYELGTIFESPGLELNDAGILSNADDIESWAELTYRETRLGRHFRNYKISLEGNTGWNFGGIRQYSNVGLEVEATWLNYWITNLDFKYHDGGLDDALTRGGPLAEAPDSWSLSTFVSNNYFAVTQYSVNASYAHDVLGGYVFSLGTSVSSRIRDRIRLSISTRYQETDSKRQYVGHAIPNGGDSSDPEYVFSHLAQSRLVTEVRGSYFFSPFLSLELYAEPFAESGRYYNYGVLSGPGSPYLDFHDSTSRSNNFESFDTDSDYGYRSFRSSMVLRWEFVLGSTAYFVWQRNMSDNVNPGRTVRFGSLFDGFSGDGVDMVAIKISHWLPVS